MMFVFYWMLLAFGGLVSFLGITFTVLAVNRKPERRMYLSLGVASFLVAWAPLVAFFALMYFVMGARPAEG